MVYQMHKRNISMNSVIYNIDVTPWKYGKVSKNVNLYSWNIWTQKSNKKAGDPSTDLKK